jgi:hypothetical protein
MVGIGGGVPSAEAGIRLGDVVISRPENHNSGVIQYDFGKKEALCGLDFSTVLLKYSKIQLQIYRPIISEEKIGFRSTRRGLTVFNYFRGNMPALISYFSQIATTLEKPHVMSVIIRTWQFTTALLRLVTK